MILNLNDLTVQSFVTVAGDPTQWLRLPVTATDEEETPCCENNVENSFLRTCSEED